MREKVSEVRGCGHDELQRDERKWGRALKSAETYISPCCRFACVSGTLHTIRIYIRSYYCHFLVIVTFKSEKKQN